VALHVLFVPVELSVARVAERVRQGGHSVPEDKVRSRYERLWPLVAQAVAMCDVASCYDNSHYDGPRLAARYQSGLLTGTSHWPSGTPRVLIELDC
jgi:predicted ABC-type ATPase